MTLSIFICHAATEEAWFAQLSADGEREMAEWERDEDRAQEEQLAREAVTDDALDAWPWYADAPSEVIEPQIIVDADLLGLPVDGDPDDDEDDEVPVDAWDEYDGERAL